MKSELEQIEKNFMEESNAVFQAVTFIEDLKNQSIDNYLRVLFLFIDFLVESKYTQEDHDFIADKLKVVFEEANSKYFGNHEFLFFNACMMYIAANYFGDYDIPDADRMFTDAVNAQPNNLVYRWALCSYPDQRPEANRGVKYYYSKLILSDESVCSWLRSKGLLGEYVLGFIEADFENSQPQSN